MKYLLLLLLALSINAQALPLMLKCDPPESREDGTAINELITYRFYRNDVLMGNSTSCEWGWIENEGGIVEFYIVAADQWYVSAPTELLTVDFGSMSPPKPPRNPRVEPAPPPL